MRELSLYIKKTLGRPLEDGLSADDRRHVTVNKWQGTLTGAGLFTCT